jgi:hypothetical protein
MLARTYEQMRDYKGAQINYKEALAGIADLSAPGSANRGLMLRSYSDFLWKKGDLIGSFSARVKAWSALANLNNSST